MRMPDVMVPEDIVVVVLAAPVVVSKPSSSATPAGEASCKNAPAQRFVRMRKSFFIE
jgi:hypothetical protein